MAVCRCIQSMLESDCWCIFNPFTEYYVTQDFPQQKSERYEINILDANYIYMWKVLYIICECMKNFAGVPRVEYWLTMDHNVRMFRGNSVCGEVSWTPVCDIKTQYGIHFVICWICYPFKGLLHQHDKTHSFNVTENLFRFHCVL